MSGANASDSVGAILTLSLIVEVHDSTGALAPAGTTVTFTGFTTPGASVEAFVQSQGSGSFVAFTSGSTNSAGQIGVKVKLGLRAGVGRIAVDVATLDLTDTARFTITPGAPNRVLAFPTDTALHVDRSFTLRGGVVDAYGNARSDPVMWSGSGTGIAVSSAGVVTGSAIGRHSITGTSGSLGQTTNVSVVPQGRLAAFQSTGVGSGNIIALDLDGANWKTLAPIVDGGIGPHPSWIPGTDKIIYTHYNGTNQILRTVDQNGAVNPFFSTPPATMTHQAEPTPAFAAQFMYFSAWNSQCGGTFYCLHRSRLDASEIEALGSFITTSGETRSPAPSPDGSKIAFTTGSQIRIFDVATKTVSTWSLEGYSPAWSPDGTQIAFVFPDVVSGDGRIKLVNPNGGGERFLTSAASSFLVRPIGWSPDGKWIVARGGGLLNVINAETGAVLPLPYSNQLVVASWK